MPRQASFVLCALLVGSLGDEATETKKTKKKKRASKDWSKVDLDAVGREWESGDEADELKTESQVYEEMIERRRAASEDGGWMDPAQITKLDPKKLTEQMAHQQSDTGAAMLFVTLTDKQMTGANKGDAWSEKAEQQFAGILTALLKTGGLNVQAYRIGERKLLLSTMTGWYGRVVAEKRLSEANALVDFHTGRVPDGAALRHEGDLGQRRLPERERRADPRARRRAGAGQAKARSSQEAPEEKV